MKKLLILAFATLCAASIQAQPVAQDAQFATFAPVYSGELSPLVTGGTPAYEYSLQQALGDDIEVSISPSNGQFVASVPLKFMGETQFQYIVTDANGDVSNPGTITIKFGPEKG